MKSTFAALALLGAALANPMPQDAVTSAVAPESPAPSGCSESAPGEFQISVVNVTTSAEKRKRQLDGTLMATLEDGVMMDQAGRTGYIAANFQFQFDSPPQAGALYTSGFSLCSNNSVALGGSAIFYQCWSGGFFNLYDREWADHCVPVYFDAVTGGGGSPVTQITDGQPQGTPVTQISDGQPQAPTAPVVTQITDGQPQAPTAPVISQISDGQPQAPTAPVISQISDGQPQAPTGAPVLTQISDGQPQAPVLTQISDGQPQAPVITQISDGQPQAPVITQISDGQPQAPVGTGNYTVPNATAPIEFPGAAATPAIAFGAFAAGLIGFAALL